MKQRKRAKSKNNTETKLKKKKKSPAWVKRQRKWKLELRNFAVFLTPKT